MMSRCQTTVPGPGRFKMSFLAASTECSAGSNDHFVVVVVGVVVVVVGDVPSLVQFDGRPLGGANFQY
jgi:hypothetical protein